jgi:SAM-dependent methyltransferase
VTAQQALPGAEDATERDPLDFNRTPAWVVQVLVPHLGAPRTVLDVGCGDGAIGRVLRQAWPDVCMVGAELHAGRAFDALGAGCYDLVTRADWLAKPWDPSSIPIANCALIISNPPFGLAALPFLQRAVERVAPGGTVAFLLPTHWDQDEDSSCGRPLGPGSHTDLERLRASLPRYARQRWLDSLRLADGREGYCKLSIVGRPSFRGGATASDRYAWFLFGEAWAGRPGFRLHALPPEEPTRQLDLLGAT